MAGAALLKSLNNEIPDETMSLLRLQAFRKSFSVGLRHSRELFVNPSLVRKPILHRSFHNTHPLSSSVAQHGGKGRPAPGTGIKIFFKNHKGELIKEVEGNEGDDMVDLSWEWDLDIEAACEKSVACSTCHCIFEPDVYNQLPEPSEDEEDMLDLAFGLTDTSRLGCQVKLTKSMHGTTVTLPSATRNLRVDGWSFRSKPSH
ncbi:cytochrome c oxidase subunit XV assembly protein [Puccinia sorghi]|uniref:Cytochrome c oxidase subunit XV assembly protein n=1 Tax=Puccinia sorghi TaxID=27349 RepID=A0A0L6VTF0_9BASI|nr:cytochrome c oxidase subunit XV assembly protein [Puccinia sorghi]